MKLDTSHLEMKVDTKESRVFFNMKDNEDAQVEYTLHTQGEPNVLETTRTFVPKALRNKGVATQLAYETMSFAKTNGYKVKPTCSFIDDYMNKHPEFQDLRVTN